MIQETELTETSQTIDDIIESSKEKSIAKLQTIFSDSVRLFKPPEKLTCSEWADKYRILSRDNSAEPGLWKTRRVPYMKEIMDTFTDYHVRKITIVASSQVAKTEVLMNMLGFMITQDPGGCVFIQPTKGVAEDFSKRRLDPMIRDTPQLSKCLSQKGRDKRNTILKKTYLGGMLTIGGSNSAAELCSIPARYAFGDERDRWAKNAGKEGDPWELLWARQITFPNSKMVECSTPTIKGASAIEASFYTGTQEHYYYECPNCKEYHQIKFKDIVFDFEKKKVHNENVFIIKSVAYKCPDCEKLFTEFEMKAQQKAGKVKWIADNPDAYKSKNPARSFWLNGFSSPWLRWEVIVQKFLEAGDDPEKLQVVYNTLLGELWEDRSEAANEDELLARREMYNAELPEGVILLTMGCDTQDDRLEYEVVGHGRFGETWGIKRGYIMGRPDDDATWDLFDQILEHDYKFADGKAINIRYAFIDSGGHFTQEIYRRCKMRESKKLFAIKGVGGEGIPFTPVPTKNKIVMSVPVRSSYGTVTQQKKIVNGYLYKIGVDAGKSLIMSNLRVQEPGAKYCHFPLEEEKGYNEATFRQLLAEHQTLSKIGGRLKWKWEIRDGYQRNESLDCRNYAIAAFYALQPDMEAEEKALKERKAPEMQVNQYVIEQPKPKRKRKSAFDI